MRSFVASSSRAFVAALVVVSCAFAGALRTDVAQADTGPRWVLPVDAQVVRPFVEPLSRFGPGHRGADFAVSAGTPVRAAGAGVIRFAGTVADALHVVVAHDGGLRTSYSFLSRVDVRIGDAVAKGQVVGATGGAGEGHGAESFHLGLRVGDRYVDPMQLFGPRDLTELVRLVPADERAQASRSDPAHEERELCRFFSKCGSDGGGDGGDGGCGISTPLGEIDVCEAFDDATDWAGDRFDEAFEAGLDLLRRAGDAAADLADRLDETLRDFGETVADAATAFARRVLLASPIGVAYRTVVAVGAFITELTKDCDRDAPDADGAGGSGNRLFSVAGIDSFRRTDHNNANRLDWNKLGYASDDVDWFSYKPGSPTYTKDDTYRGLVFEARSLGEQLKAEARAHPGRPVDLIGHSQGGVVIRVFLDQVYRGHADEFPPIGKVITFGSPLKGAPLATLNGALHKTPLGDVIDALTARLGLSPPSSAESVKQLSEDSEAIRRINKRPPPNGIRILSISGWFDPVVPATATGGKGVTTYTVTAGNPLLPDDHSALLQDDDALRAARAQLEGRTLPCRGVFEIAASIVVPEVIDRFEHLQIPGTGVPSPV